MDSDIQVAEHFGTALAEDDFAAAYGLLTGEALAIYSPEKLEEAVAEMTAYAPGPIHHVEVMSANKDSPALKPGDIAWVYVALVGEDFSEAVSVVLSSTPDGARIRDIEWGRP